MQCQGGLACVSVAQRSGQFSEVGHCLRMLVDKSDKGDRLRVWAASALLPAFESSSVRSNALSEGSPRHSK